MLICSWEYKLINCSPMALVSLQIAEFIAHLNSV